MYRILLSIGLLSLAMIAYQISLMQYLSIVQWYHYAYMVISIALLGFGAAGTVISLFRKSLLRHMNALLPFLIFFSGLSMPLAIRVSGMPFARFDTYLLFVERRQLWQLLLNYIIFFIPFFFCALAIGLVFVKYVREIGKLYFANLTGSGLGGLVAIVLFWTVSPARIAYITGGMAVIAAILVIPAATALPKEKRAFYSSPRFLYTFFPLLLPLLFAGYYYPPEIISSQYKSLNRTLLLPDAEICWERNSPHGWVQYVSSPALRYAPGLSLAYPGDIPVVDALFNNGEWYGAIFPETAEKNTDVLAYTTSAIASEIISPEKVLVLNAGTGMRVSHFLNLGIPSIDATESHPLITSFAKRNMGYSRLFQQDPRSFLRKPGKQYDLICLPYIGAFGGTAGLQAMQEEYLLTTEAFSLIYDRLSDHGIIEVTCWTDNPYRNPLKTAASIAEMLSQKGIETPLQQTVAVRSWNTITFLVKKSPFTEAQQQSVRDFCERLYFDPLLLPGITEEERTTYNDLEDKSLFSLTDSIFSRNREAVYKNYDFHIRPATDDQPYFSQFLRWKSFPQLQRLYGQQSASFLELGYLIVLVTFVQSAMLAIIFIVLPLFRFRKKSGGKLQTLFYFSGLGIGYMFVEIVLIQQFTLYLGHPVYAITAVIGTMLLLSGTGSYLSSRLSPKPAVLRKVTLLITVLLLLYGWFLTAILQAGTGFPFFVKIFLAVILIGIPAVIMGMPFPLGLRYLSQQEKANIPWAWGINSCMSVVSTALATIIALESGFILLMIFAALAYFITFSSSFLKPDQS
ncbi:spermidine synthase-like protein [Sinomicrobium weinanense]|uniref:Spermidine synthase-like protein n=1 Tax=Sinomicrobium weinanense TaxID=2842200 RepID=A0A926JST9_9FLAO|nr:spermidine synthase-like protein [Sinomicrobium weinanense]MBC9796714.1 spermidine synthase-like protein [Sinomicrobium weinanense]MBU3123011.1 hypothetical protein [Sinomicrobium weinanense]